MAAFHARPAFVQKQREHELGELAEGDRTDAAAQTHEAADFGLVRCLFVCLFVCCCGVLLLPSFHD